jgi:hypothetical protein
MRIYGRIIDELGNKTWVVVTPDANGFKDNIYITNLIQVLKLYLGESPFWANYGIPAQMSVIQQVMPDFYINRTQTQFSQYFASLIVSRIADNPPTYNINAVSNNGAIINVDVAT